MRLTTGATTAGALRGLLQTALFACLGLAICEGCGRRTPEDELGKLLNEYRDDENVDWDDPTRTRIVRWIAGQVRLTNGEDRHGFEATRVSFCEALSGPQQRQCVSGVTGADDTAHIREFPYTAVQADPSLSFDFVDPRGKRVQPLSVAYTVHPHSSELHPLQVPDDRGLSLTESLKQGPIVIAAFSEVAPHGHLKHVWVVDSLTQD